MILRRKYPLSSLLFFWAYGLFILLTTISTSFYFRYIMGSPYRIGIGICLGLLILKELATVRNTKRGALGLMVCLIMIALIYLADISNRNIVMITFFLVYCSRNISFEKIGWFTLKFVAFLVVIIIMSSLIGVIPNYTSSTGGRERQYIGFLYALFPSTIVCNETMLLFYLKRNKIKWKEIVVALAINVWIYNQTKSRLTFLFAVVVLLTGAVKKLKPGFIGSKFSRRIMASIPLLCGVFSVAIASLYSPSNIILLAIDKALDGRVSIAHSAMESYGFKLFGTHFAMIGNGLDAMGNNTSRLYLAYSYIDNLYIQLLLRNGIIFFLLFMAILIFSIHKAVIIDKDGYLSFILSMLAVEAIIQDSFLSLNFNTFLFIIASLMLIEAREYRKGRDKTWALKNL